MKYRIAVITPIGASDNLADTVLDGLISVREKNPEFVFAVPGDFNYESALILDEFKLKTDAFLDFAKDADLIFLFWSKREINFGLAEKIGRWNKTIYIDGSEVGRNRRYDALVQSKIIAGTYDSHGKIDSTMLEKCAMYFRREKPYIRGIIPLPFGIERRYLKFFGPDVKKDIDFFCIFGQDEYPPMRKFARELVRKFCAENGFSCQTEHTGGFSFDPSRKSGRDEFYKLLGRSKVGISIGGGGFDTGRFWEILGNNCYLLTETVDIFKPDENDLNYERIWQFANLHDLWHYLHKMGKILRTTYNEGDLFPEYKRILADHSSEARIRKILSEARAKGLIT